MFFVNSSLKLNTEIFSKNIRNPRFYSYPLKIVHLSYLGELHLHILSGLK